MAALKDKDRDELSKREKNARDRYIRLVYISETDKVVQKKVNDGTKIEPEWGDAHKLETRGSEATDCTCPDSRFRNAKCYHQIAWEDWTFDEVVFDDGTKVEL